MTKYYVTHSFKIIILFLSLSALTMLTLGFSTLKTRFGPIPAEAYLLSAIEEFYRNAVPFELTFDEVLYMWQLAIPLIAAFNSYYFLKFYKSNMIFMLNKKSRYLYETQKNTTINALIGALSIFIGYIICLTITAYFFPTRGITTTRYTLFTNLRIDSFFWSNHYYLYYMLKGFFDYFIVPFELILLGNCIGLISENKYLVIISTLLYYIFGICVLTMILNIPFNLNYFEQIINKDKMCEYLIIYHLVYFFIINIISIKYINIKRERV